MHYWITSFSQIEQRSDVQQTIFPVFVSTFFSLVAFLFVSFCLSLLLLLMYSISFFSSQFLPFSSTNMDDSHHNTKNLDYDLIHIFHRSVLKKVIKYLPRKDFMYSLAHAISSILTLVSNDFTNADLLCSYFLFLACNYSRLSTSTHLFSVQVTT